MLEFHPVQERPVAAERLVELLQTFRDVVEAEGMADMDEYGDMLNWGLPSKDGVSRSLHVFHPDFCSWSDAFYGTIHYHGTEVRGTILAGRVAHDTYKPTPNANGDRFLGDQAFHLERHTIEQAAGTQYVLPARVAHWFRPLQPTLTYFEEDPGDMGDLVNPRSDATDEFQWEQEDADAFLPELLRIIDARLAELQVTA